MPQNSDDAWSAKSNHFSNTPVPVGPRRAVGPVANVHGAEFDDHGPETDLAEYWQILWKRRILILAVFATIFALGTAITLLMPAIYRASATIQVDREASKVLGQGDTLQTSELLSGDEFYQTQYGLLKGRFLAERVVGALHLADNETALKAIGWKNKAGRTGETAAEKRARRARDAVTLVEESLKVDPVHGSRLVEIGFDSRDPALSAQVANAMADNFITSNLERRFEAASYARQFLEQKLAQVKDKLEDSEKAAVTYAGNQQIINIPVPTNGNEPATAATESLVAANLTALNSSLAAATNQRIQVEQRWHQVQNTPGLSIPEVMANPTVQRLLEERAKVGAEYQQKLASYKPDHPTMRQLKGQLDEMDREIQAQVSHTQQSLSAQYQTAVNQERSLQGQVNGLKSSMIDLSNRSIKYNILQREVDTNRTLYEGLLQRYKEVGIAGGVGTNNVSIVDRAQPPLKPSVPNVPLYITASAAIGLILGVLAAITLEALDEDINAPSDVENKLKLPLVGAAPMVERGVTPALALRDGRSALSEAFNAIRTMLQFSTGDGPPRTLLVTSSRPSEGKSTTAIGLAHSFARLGGRVLLVDGDMRNPSLHRAMSINNANGLSKYLAAAATFDEIVQPSGVEHLSIVTCGPLPPHPSELLAGGALARFLEEATAQYDMVIVDGPPVVGLSDAVSLAAAVVGTVFVVESGKVRRALAKASIRRLTSVDAWIVGVVLSKFNARNAAYGYEYQYHYSYGNKRLK